MIKTRRFVIGSVPARIEIALDFGSVKKTNLLYQGTIYSSD
jgi:hypothetical protein